MVRAHRKRQDSSSDEDGGAHDHQNMSAAGSNSSSATWRAKRLAQKRQKRADVDADSATQDDGDFWSRMATSLPQTRDHIKDSVERPIEDKPDSDTHSASDHPSDLEGTSDLDESERAVFISQKRQARREEKRKMTELDSKSHKEHLEEMQRTRLAALNDTTEQGSSLPATFVAPLTQAMFQLMQRTAAALSNSPNPMQLEMKIYANHGNDSRFAFLRDDAEGGQARDVWLKLKAGQDIKWEDVINEQENEANSKAAILSGYDSDSDTSGISISEKQPVQDAPQETDKTQDQTSSSPEATSSNTAKKQEERRARAREWAASQRSNQGVDVISPTSQQDLKQQQPSPALTGKEKFALEQKERIRLVAEKAKQQAQQKAASMRLVEMSSREAKDEHDEANHPEEENTFDLMEGATEDAAAGDGDWGQKDDVLRIG